MQNRPKASIALGSSAAISPVRSADDVPPGRSPAEMLVPVRCPSRAFAVATTEIYTE